MSLEEMIKRDREAAATWAAGALTDEGAVILDTETTGLDRTAEVIEIAVINMKGEVLLQSLVNPHGGEVGAVHIHGITKEMVATAPTWEEIDQEVISFLFTASRVVIYNAGFDSIMIDQSRNKWGLSDLLQVEPLEKILVDMEGSTFDPTINWECAMRRYSEWSGDWSEHHGNYRWQRLTSAARRFGAETNGAHRALDDARMTLAVIRGMAKAARNEAVQE